MMGTKTLIFSCVLWTMTLQLTSVSAQLDNLIPNASQVSQPSTDERFKIPPETRDTRFDPLISDWVSESVMRFAHDLATALDRDDYPNTQIFSPVSIMSSLSLLQMGAHGSTYNQLSKLFYNLVGDQLHDSWKIHEEFGWLLEDLMSDRNGVKRPRGESEWRKTPANRNAFGTGGANTPDEHTIRVANGLFIQNGFSLRPDYQYAAQSVYKSEVTPLNFRTRSDYAKHYINSWINQNTLGKIPAIIADEVQRDTNMIIASALYFKGYWQQPFIGSGTSDADFFPDGPTSLPVRVKLMGAGGVFPYYDSPEYNCHIIGLPYKGNQTTMYVIQPHDSTRRSLNDLQRLLTGDKLNGLIARMEQRTGVVAFPKFHVTSTLHLKTPLMRMGITDVFKQGASDLSLIADASQYVQQAVSSFAPAKSVGSIISPPAAASFAVPEAVLTPQSAAAPPRVIPQQPPTFKKVNRIAQNFPQLAIYDRYNEPALIFTRFDNSVNNSYISPVPLQQIERMKFSQPSDPMTIATKSQQRSKRTVTYKVESEFMRSNLPLRLKDLILSKRITKPNPGKKLSRSRRQALPDAALSLQNIDRLRVAIDLPRPPLYADEVIHKVDFNVNEQGTEAAAATLTYLRRSGPDVAFRCDKPFLLLVRHDPTKLPLFYGKVNIPLP